MNEETHILLAKQTAQQLLKFSKEHQLSFLQLVRDTLVTYYDNKAEELRKELEAVENHSSLIYDQ